LDEDEATGTAVFGIRRAVPVLDAAIDLQHRLVVPRASPASAAKKSQSLRCPCAHNITLMLEPPPSTFPIDNGIDRPLTFGLGSARKFQSRSVPRLSRHWSAFMTAGTSSSPPASSSNTLTSGSSASRRDATDPEEPDPQKPRSRSPSAPDY
jgi:hypothetical protein